MITPTRWTALATIALTLTAIPSSAATLRELASVQIVSNLPFDDQLKAARAIGLGRVRLAVRWDAVERPRGIFTWRPTDDRIKAARRAGLTPIVVIFGGNGGYPPLTSGALDAPEYVQAAEGFAGFAAAAAKRYGGGTRTVPILYEIWNEPNTKTFWGSAPIPEQYADVAVRACQAIKRAVPEAQVLGLAMEGTPVKAPYVHPVYGIEIYREWASRAATPTLTGCVDGISMHPYLNRPEQVLRDEPALQAFVATHWRGPRPPRIAHSEVGYTIDPKRGGTAQQQAALDLRALLIGAGLGRVTSLYQSVDTGIDLSKPDQNYGLVSKTGVIKPVGVGVQRLLRNIGDYAIEGVGVLQGRGSGAGDTYRFSARDGKAGAEVLWTSLAEYDIAVPAGAIAVDLVSGATVPLSGGHIRVGVAPVLVTWGG